MYKHWVHEGGIATPLVVQWPETITTGGELTDEVGHIMDIMATCCDVAGAEYPAERNGQEIVPLQGKSLKPIFQGRDRDGYETLFWEHLGNRAVRQGRWKLVSRDRGEWELYDMVEDRSELTNLANEQPERTEEMALQFMTWAEQVGVRL
jgi:arylsulfatase